MEETLRAGKILALLGSKIRECDEAMTTFPDDKYHKGARDMAVNLLKEIEELLANPVEPA